MAAFLSNRFRTLRSSDSGGEPRRERRRQARIFLRRNVPGIHVSRFGNTVSRDWEDCPASRTLDVLARLFVSDLELLATFVAGDNQTHDGTP